MVKSLAKAREIPVLGFYDPSSSDLSGQDFFHAFHSHDYVVKKIFKGHRQMVANG
jgi:hypothetical protein